MSTIQIVEVGPRDGLQNESPISIADRVQLINLLSQSGITKIEAGSFVSPKWVPAMADSDQVFAQIQRQPGIQYTALTPNKRGMEQAIQAQVDEVAIFAAASEAFSQKNINCSIKESLQRFDEVMTLAKAQQLPVRGYVSCVLGCPYQGKVDPKVVAEVVTELYRMGCYEISLGDTIGVGTANQVHLLLAEISKTVPIEALAVHFHDTYGQALTNIYAALDHGIHTIDSAVGGLGGCPYAHGASGNVATEDVVYLLNGLGLEHAIDLPKLLKANQFIHQLLNKQTQSKVAQALLHS